MQFTAVRPCSSVSHQQLTVCISGSIVGGSITGRSGSEDDYFYSDEEAIEADNEGDAEPCDEENEDDAESNIGTNTGWADAMAKVLNKKTPESKPTILVKNKKLEKEKEKLKQERREKIKQSVVWNLYAFLGSSGDGRAGLWLPYTLSCTAWLNMLAALQALLLEA
ncbi:hypothetical protein P7K49_035990 [Saguinus oedipus]|uniref:RRP15-like protein n=1 Tax=Saguinus oedipus TaxID=9490 RepID=A0ABQ9TPW3_SAGOE|nr:hypothetical protein P7K49_035990 [Saguinus oedipus]